MGWHRSTRCQRRTSERRSSWSRPCRQTSSSPTPRRSHLSLDRGDVDEDEFDVDLTNHHLDDLVVMKVGAPAK